MTKFKEYLRSAKGMLLDCDFEALPCAGIEHFEPRVLGNGIEVVTHYMYYSDVDKMMVSRDGWCHRLSENWSVTDERFDKRYAEAPNGFSDYVDWLRDVGFSIHAFVFDWLKRLYLTEHEVRIAFMHMRAGIMSEVALCRLLARRYKKVLGYYGVY